MLLSLSYFLGNSEWPGNQEQQSKGKNSQGAYILLGERCLRKKLLLIKIIESRQSIKVQWQSQIFGGMSWENYFSLGVYDYS